MPEPIEYNSMTKEENTGPTKKVDIRKEKCPYTFILAKLALEEVGVGEVLEIHLDNIMALNNLPRAFIYQGQEYLGTERLSESEWLIRIRRIR